MTALVALSISGWAQISRRNALSWERRFVQDAWYVYSQPPGLDLSGLMSTIWKIPKRRGIGKSGQATAQAFMGSQS